MRLQELFQPRDLLVGFTARDKWDAIERMMKHLVATGRLTSDQSPAILEAVLNRERSMSTGMERNIAIPHAAVEDLPHVVAALAIVNAHGGLKFDSIDGTPTHLVVLLLIPKAQKLLHIRTLADVARVLGREEVREELLAAKSAQDAWAALAEPA